MSELCLSCGLCCDGSLFQLVKLQPGESDPRLRLVPEHEAFAQPCSCFAAGACAIYEQRPAACRDFRCRLLGQPLAPALGVVARTKKLLAAPRGHEAELDLLLEEHFRPS